MTETNPPYAERDIRVEDVALVCDHRERMFLEAGHDPRILTTMTEHFRPWLRDQIERGTKIGRPLYESLGWKPATEMAFVARGIRQ